MSTYRRNVLVGITVLSALIILGWMIIRFGGNLAQPFAAEAMVVHFYTDRADGVSEGSAVMYRGVSVGRVVKVRRDDKNFTMIWFDAEIEVDPPLPGDVTAIIRQASLLGSGSRIELKSEEVPTGARLKANQSIQATFVGLDFFPPEIKTLSVELAGAAKQFREANVIGSFKQRLDEASDVLKESHKTMENLNKIIGDPKFNNDIQTTITNIKDASENVKSVTSHADKLVDGLQGAVDNVDKATLTAQSRLEEIAGITKQANEIVAKINNAQGTAGKLVNDPKLYEGLVESTAQLNATLKDLNRLVQQWEQEGVSLKLR